MSVGGIIKAVTYAPRGEIDGAVLDNGTIVHVPPPVGMQYASLFRVGAPGATCLPLRPRHAPLANETGDPLAMMRE